MLNPPRKVKRLRELALKDPQEDSPSEMHISPPPAPREDSPPAQPSTPRRRGRKPAGPLSKSAREQLRKTNHSVIEKRRREKINGALAALRELVPNDKAEGEKKEDKEFKLEVLVRTVEYLRIMLAKVKKLEGGMCQKCNGGLRATNATTSSKPPPEPEDRDTTMALKRKRMEDDDEINSDSEPEDFEVVFLAPAHESQVAPSQPCSKSPLPRLPSISTWMLDPSIGFMTPVPLINSHAFQLPSPPHTAPFAPTVASTGTLPRLVLPSPGFPLTLPHQTQSGSLSPRREPTSHVSPLPGGSHNRDVPEFSPDTPGSNPRPPHPQSSSSSGHKRAPAQLANAPTHREDDQVPWSRDDQTAASLLLNISSLDRRDLRRESRSQSALVHYHGDQASVSKGGIGVPPQRRLIEAQTPSSVLGISVLGMADGPIPSPEEGNIRLGSGRR